MHRTPLLEKKCLVPECVMCKARGGTNRQSFQVPHTYPCQHSDPLIQYAAYACHTQADSGGLHSLSMHGELLPKSMEKLAPLGL